MVTTARRRDPHPIEPVETGAVLEHLADKLAALPWGLPRKLASVERIVIARALRNCSGNFSAAARALGIERRVLVRMWDRLTIPDTEDPREDS